MFWFWINVNKKFSSITEVTEIFIRSQNIFPRFKMSKLQVPESPAMFFSSLTIGELHLILKLNALNANTFIRLKKIKKHMCHILDHIICKGCEQYYPNKLMKRHLFTYYKCKQHYEENENDKMELKKILKERKLNDLDEEPYPMKCLCIWNVGKCHFCDLWNWNKVSNYFHKNKLLKMVKYWNFR